MVAHLRDADIDPRYAGFFDLFNRQEFFAAHEVLEDLWLESPGANYSFHKGLIQLAGAFVHLQKGRLQPAAALFRLCRENLAKYPACHERLDTGRVQALISQWLGKLESGQYAENPWLKVSPPRLDLDYPDWQSASSRYGLPPITRTTDVEPGTRSPCTG